MSKRYTFRQVESLARDWAERHNETYGNNAGQVYVALRDGRMAPFVWALHRKDKGGGYVTLHGPCKVSELVNFLNS